ncbi:helix-turn-helix domain-containing protein [Erythrobacter westpacificensis]|uniref:Helix-turn-helix domain-containing protein n=1 Tax=Erythrobacter westpacificensis TaxID=1055231 RepID=A0ABP9KN42_9SPHN
MTQPARSIPVFSLFGEDVGEQLPEYFHWETIEARSAGYHWEIASHRHPALFQVLFLKEGMAEIVLDRTASSVEAPALVIVPAGRTHGFRFSDRADGLVMTGRKAFLGLLGAGDPLHRVMNEAQVVLPTADAAERLAGLAVQLLSCEVIAADANRTALRANLAEAWLRLVVTARDVTGEEASLCDRFIALVERHCHEHWTVQTYACGLGCTPRTLARATRETLELSPLEYVNRRLASEARRLLNFTNANVAQVADALGFEDPSYFSRFYLRMTGRRPSAERRQISNPQMGQN